MRGRGRAPWGATIVSVFWTLLDALGQAPAGLVVAGAFMTLGAFGLVRLVRLRGSGDEGARAVGPRLAVAAALPVFVVGVFLGTLQVDRGAIFAEGYIGLACLGVPLALLVLLARGWGRAGAQAGLAFSAVALASAVVHLWLVAIAAASV